MFIFAFLLLTKFESTNLMGISEKRTLGLYFSNFTFTGYFLSLNLGKTVTLGIEGNGQFTNYPAVSPGSSYSYKGSGNFGITLSKYFIVSKPVSPLIAINPNYNVYYSYSNYSSYFDKTLNHTYGINFDAGVEYFFSCWDRKFSAQLKTPLISVYRACGKRTYTTGYGNDSTVIVSSTKDDISFRVPLKGGISTYLCWHF